METNKKITIDKVSQMLVERFKMEGIDDQKKVTLIQNMAESVIQRVMLNAFEKLEDMDQDIFSNMMDENNPPAPEKVDEFLIEKLGEENLNAIIIKAVEDMETSVNKHKKA